MKYSILATLLFIGMNAVAQTNYPNEKAEGAPAQMPRTVAPAKPGSTTAPSDNYNTASSDSLDSRPLSRGGFFIEPMILTTQEDTSIKTSQLALISNDTSGTSKGYGIGMRFGGHVNETVLLGLDARYAKTQLDDSFYQKADSNAYNIAPMIALQTPYFGVRLLASYVVAGENDPDAGYRGLDLKFREASGWRVGAGLFVAAVSLNLEYQDINYNSTEVQSLGSNQLNRLTAVDANNRGYTVSLSFPVEL